jgi:glutamate synthase domain-containing protein 3
MGKGLSGGKIIVYPPKTAKYSARENIIVGNTLLYGAINGEVYINGVAGERFGVRNSGVTAVVEGVGDHGCEYMTGGVAVILGPTGRNFAAGMSGGMAFVLDETGDFKEKRCNYQIVISEDLESPEDIALVKSLIEKHVKYTNSEKGKEILLNFEAYIPKFVKVISPAYKKILAERALAATNQEV